MILDRMRFSVIEVNTNEILARDLVVKEPEVRVNLSGPSITTFKLDQGQQVDSAYGVNFKTWGQWIIPEIEISGMGKICLGAQLITKLKPDPKTYDLSVEATGFMQYPKGIPWLENLNPIAIDPAEVIQRIWAHLQSFPNANLGVEVFPSTTGTQMLPGFGFDGNQLNFDFWAIFIRAVDFNDCGDQIMQLARDLPLDLQEVVTWNDDRTAVNKTVKIDYPFGGVRQDNLAFRLGENVIDAEVADEAEIQPVTDVIIRSWIPGKTYTSMLSNADMTRARRTIMEEAVNISNTERAAAWAGRKLTRRNIPKSFKKITIDPSHPHAPIGSFWLGDSIFVEAFNYPWWGTVQQWHRVTDITFKEGEPLIDVGLKVEGAFNYDPITYDPDAVDQPGVDLNLIPNGYFTNNLAGWYAIRGQWIRVATEGYSGPGEVRIDCDDAGEEFRSARINLNSGETVSVQAAFKTENVTHTTGATNGFQLSVQGYKDGGPIGSPTIVDHLVVAGVHQYTVLKGDYTFPSDDSVNEIAVSLKVNSDITGGTAWWDDVRVLRP